MPIILLTATLGYYGDVNPVMMNLPIGLLLYYLLFSRYSNKVEIDGTELKIIYFFPWDEDLTLDLEDCKDFRYEKIKWSCYDIIRLTAVETDVPVEIRLNMKMNTRIQLFNHLQNWAKPKIYPVNTSV